MTACPFEQIEAINANRVYAHDLRKVTFYVTLANMNAHGLHNNLQIPVKAKNLSSWLLSQGISSVTTGEIAQIIDTPINQLSQRMRALAERNEMVSPARGLWIPVSPEYREWGAPEAITYIDALMNHLGANYYVGWMSAAALLGASHHASQVFQVATSKTVQKRVIGRSRINCYTRSNVASLPSFQFKTRTGFAKVSTRAATMLSIANDTNLTAGLNNAANIIIELSETDEPYLREISECAHLFPMSALRRLGWIMDNFTETPSLDDLVCISQASEIKLSKLSMNNAYSGHIDRKWSIDLNTKIEPDV